MNDRKKKWEEINWNTIEISVSLLWSSWLYRLVSDQCLANRRSSSWFLLHPPWEILWSSRSWRKEQRIMVQRRLLLGYSNVARHQITRCWYCWSSCRFPSTIWPLNQHDSFLHRQTEKILTHLQKLWHHHHLNILFHFFLNHQIIVQNQILRNWWIMKKNWQRKINSQNIILFDLLLNFILFIYYSVLLNFKT